MSEKNPAHRPLGVMTQEDPSLTRFEEVAGTKHFSEKEYIL